MENDKEYPVADVTAGQVEAIRGLEQKLTAERGNNVVLIAYEEKREK